MGAKIPCQVSVADNTPPYRNVGPDETDARTGAISIDSPLARAALKKRVGETIEVTLPDRRIVYRIVCIAYETP